MSRLGLMPVEVQRLAAEPERLGGLQHIHDHEPSRLFGHARAPAERAATRCLQRPYHRPAPRETVTCRLQRHLSRARLAFQYGPSRRRRTLRSFSKPGKPKPIASKSLIYKEKSCPSVTLTPLRPLAYGASRRITEPTRVATVAAGYADGYPRSLGNEGSVRIGNVSVPVIGRVSMDLITLDVSNAPHAGPGDMVELIGPHHDADAVATQAGTIGYEILTRLGHRYHRHYIEGTA